MELGEAVRRESSKFGSQNERSPLEDATATDRCVVCLEKITEKAVAIPCRHQTFDFICLASWLHQNSLCPLCKCDVSGVEYGFETQKSIKTYLVTSTKLQVSQQDNPNLVSAPASWVLRSRPRRFHTRHTAWRSHRTRPTSPHPATAILNRRQIYQHQLYSAHVGSNRISRFQDLTPARFNSDSELISRARKWIRRELQVLDVVSIGLDALPSSSSTEDHHFDNFSNMKASALHEQTLHRRRASNAEFLLEYVLAILKTVDIKGSQGQAVSMLSEFLGHENAQLFLHELQAWLRSPYTDLETWDRHVQYPDRRRQDDANDLSSTRRHTSTSPQSTRQKRPRRSSSDSVHIDSDRRSRRLYDRYVPD